MNDKKYSPGTSETEELIDGSFRSAMNYIVSLVKSWKLDPLQRTLAIISAVSSLFFTDQSQRSGVHLDVCACRPSAALDVREESEDRIFHHGFYIFLV